MRGHDDAKAILLSGSDIKMYNMLGWAKEKHECINSVRACNIAI